MDRKGQRVITPDGKGEIIEAVAGEVKVKLDSGDITTYNDNDVSDDSTGN